MLGNGNDKDEQEQVEVCLVAAEQKDEIREESKQRCAKADVQNGAHPVSAAFRKQVVRREFAVDAGGRG